MPTITVLSPAQQRDFQEPPRFDTAGRQAHFELIPLALKYLKTLRTIDNKISFIIQWAYFNAKGFFFEASQFREIDIQYIYRVYGFPSPKTPIKKEDYQRLYGGANSLRHRKKILELKGWKEFQETELNGLVQFAAWLSEKQDPPKKMMWALHAHCWKMRWVVPSYDVLSGIISKSYTEFEETAIAKVKDQLSQANKDALEQFLVVQDNNTTLLAKTKRIDQSVRAQNLNKNAKYLSLFKENFFSNENLINELALTESASRYYAGLVMGARAFQISQFKDRNKSYLYLLAFVQHQFFRRLDAGLTGVLNAIRKSFNRANKKLDEVERKNNEQKNKAIDAISDSQKRLTEFVKDVIVIADDKKLTAVHKVERIRNHAAEIIRQHDEEFVKRAQYLDQCREKERNDVVLNEFLVEQSRSLHLAIGKTLELLVFDEKGSNPQIIEAIRYYQHNKRRIGGDAPTSFLLRKEKEAVFEDESINVPLYRMFLYRHIASHVKAGSLSLKYGYDYRSIDDLMIGREHDVAQLVEDAGLTQYKDIKQHLDLLKDKLEAMYVQVNQRHAKGDNGYLFMRPNGRFHVKTPATDYEQSKYISSVLSSEGEISILQVLREIERVCGFTELFTHQAHRNTVKAIEPEIGIAGIMALGCNIGVRRMAKKSIGIKDRAGVLLDAVNWRFSIENLTKINKRIIAEIESLKLPNIFKVEEDCVLSSSDGKKVTVAVDSLLANNSFKYFGSDKGVAIYIFVNEKQSLFHATVFSSSDREAIYLIDGLLHNSTSIRHIHTTDTHGFTEAIFAATHLIDISFAPRFKKIEDQVIYSFHPKAKYQAQGYRILPSRQINRKLIEDNWDDILRFMATIKLGRTSGSQLFKRLNSYSKDHPLYKALKEFGRVLKSLHILNFFDDLELRQKVQKQLNRVELSHRFSDAVFWDRGRQFYVGTKEEQEKQVLCKTIIQNSIIFWNYLFLSDRILKSKNQKDIEDMIDSIMKGSVLAWGHLNFTGDYDFTAPAPKGNQFNYAKLKKLEVKKPKK